MITSEYLFKIHKHNSQGGRGPLKYLRQYLLFKVRKSKTHNFRLYHWFGIEVASTKIKSVKNYNASLKL